MKKLLPILLLIPLLIGLFKFMASGAMHPAVMVLVLGGLLMGLTMIRPKSKGPTVRDEEIADALGEFSKDAFNDDSPLSVEFQTAVASFQSNMPKAAFAKLEKLAPQCRDDRERYAVAMITALICTKTNEHAKAVAAYNQAVVLNPTTEVAFAIGSCQQRLGHLKKARDSYEFALELDPRNIQAMSAMATTWVADRKYENALEYAEMALDVEENNASALATCAICHGLLGNSEESGEYTEKAVREGYSRNKIQDTIKALKK